MTFRSKIIVDYYRFRQPLGEGIRKEIYRFDRKRVKFNKRQKATYENELYVNPFDTKFADGTQYSLVKIEDDRGDTIYRIILDEFPVTLKINKWNQFKMNWIHRNHWIQKSESNWLKQSLVTGLLSIITYFVGQNIGFSRGYQDGLKASSRQDPKATQAGTIPLHH